MESTSSAYKAAIQAPFRVLRGASVTVGGSTFSERAVRSIKLTESVSDNSDRLLPGVAACASIEATVVGALSADLVGSEMTAHAGVLTAGGSVETVQLGVFIVKDIQHEPGTYISIIIGYDKMCLLDGVDFDHALDPDTETETVTMTSRSLLAAIVPFDGSGAIQWAPGVVSSLQDNFLLNRPLNELHAYNTKELLGYLAGAYGMFARMTRDGLLEFAWYEHTGYVVPLSCIYMDGLTLRSTADVADTVHFYSGDDIEESGYGDYTNDMITTERAAAMPALITTCSPGDLKFRGDPAIRAGDILTVALREGGTRRFAISEVTWHYGSGAYATAESHGVEQRVMHNLTATQREISRLKKVYHIVEKPAEEETTEGETTTTAEETDNV